MNPFRLLLRSFACLVPATAFAAPLRVAVSPSAQAEDETTSWLATLARPGLEQKRVSANPSAADLTGVDVLLLLGSREAGPDLTELRKNRGGLVVVDDFTRAAVNAAEWKSLSGAGAPPGEANAWEGSVPLFFMPPGRTHPVTAGISNFEVSGGFIWNLNMDPAAAVLATTWTPNRKHLKDGQPQPYVYGVSPVLWTLERDGRRTVGCTVKGAAALQNPAFRVLLLRSLAWAAKRDDLDGFSTAKELDSLTYPPGGPLRPDDSLRSLKVHPDFTVELVASEPLVSKPVNLDWDDRGRLWVAESVEYPEGRAGGGP